MRKRIVCFTLAAAMLMSLAGCRSAEPAATEAATEASTAAEGATAREKLRKAAKIRRQRKILRLELLPEPRLRVMKKLPRQTP